MPDGDGGLGKRRVTITVPESYRKVDDSVWEDLEKYLFLGFLTSPAVVAGKSFVFKTLNHNEVRNVTLLRPARSSPPEARMAFRAAFIAHSILFVDGQNALFERPRHLARLTKIVSKLAPDVQEKIVENLGAINARATRLYPLTEVYVHENRSRYHWLHLQSVPVHSASSTGLPGTDELGMSYCQQTWTAINRLLDKKETAERDWANAKFVGSCFNGKGVRSVDERDRGRREKDRTDLEEKKMKVLYGYLNRTAGGDAEPPSTVELPDRRKATVEKRFRADTAEELAEQLSAALSGEKDHHDRVVEEQEKKLRERARALDEHRWQIDSMPPVQILSQDGHELLSSGARILGGRKEADELLARMDAAQRKQREEANRRVRLDLSQGSDDGSDGGV